MQSRTIWRRLLGVEKTVVEDVEFEEEFDGTVSLVASVRPTSRAASRCGVCGRKAGLYDRGEGRRRWRGLDFGEVQVFLEAEAPRVRCREHAVVVAAVPWARHGAGHTHAFDQQVAWLATQASKTAITVLMRIAWRTVGAIITRYWADTCAALDAFAGLRKIGIDEISYKKGHKYLTVVVDHDSGRLVWAAPGRDKATLGSFFDALAASGETVGEDRCSLITHVSADGAEWIAGVVASRCPNAVRCADPFNARILREEGGGENVDVEIARQQRLFRAWDAYMLAVTRLAVDQLNQIGRDFGGPEVDENGVVTVSRAGRTVRLVALPAGFTAVLEYLGEERDGVLASADDLILGTVGRPATRALRQGGRLSLVRIGPFAVQSIEMIQAGLRWHLEAKQFLDYPRTVMASSRLKEVVRSVGSDGCHLVFHGNRVTVDSWSRDPSSTRSLVAEKVEALRDDPRAPVLGWDEDEIEALLEALEWTYSLRFCPVCDAFQGGTHGWNSDIWRDGTGLFNVRCPSTSCGVRWGVYRCSDHRVPRIDHSDVLDPAGDSWTRGVRILWGEVTQRVKLQPVGSTGRTPESAMTLKLGIRRPGGLLRTVDGVASRPTSQRLQDPVLSQPRPCTG